MEETVSKVFPDATFEYIKNTENRYLSPDAVSGFYRQSYMESGLDESEFLKIFRNRSVKWSNTVAIIRSGYSDKKKDKRSSADWKSVLDKTGM